MRMDVHGNLIQEDDDTEARKTVMIDRSTKKSHEEGLLKLYQQSVRFKDDAGIRSQYEGELKSFASEYPAHPEIVQEYKRGQDHSNGRGPEFNKAAREAELHSLRNQVINNRHDAQLERAYHEEVAAFADDFPEDVPEHLEQEHQPNNEGGIL